MVAFHLYETGCRNFAYISGSDQATTNIERKNSFLNAREELGISDYSIVSGGYSYEDGLRAGKQLLETSPGTDACFCVNDVTAMGVYDYIRHYSDKSIPEDLSIVGFDDLPMSRQLSYQLSTVSQPIEQMVDATFSTITDILNNPSAKPILKSIEGEFISRKTTRPLPSERSLL